MDFTATRLRDTESALQGEVRAFLADTLPLGYRPGLGIAARHDPGFSALLAERGWVGMAIPPAYGGHGRSAVERFVVTEELMAAGAPVGAHYVADRQTAPTLLRYGTEAQKQRFLPAIAAGTCWFSLGMSEPDAGSDLAAVRTTARRADGGWRVSGTKVWTSNAHLNHFMVVLCRTSPAGQDRHEGLSQLIVDLHAPGVTVRPIRFIDGSHHFNEVVLDEVEVGDDMVLGAVGSGWTQVTAELGYERSGPDRYLSTFPVIREFARRLPGTDAAWEAIGALTARLSAIRRMSLAVAQMLDQGSAPATESALVKDIGTTFEQASIEVMRAITARPLDAGSSDLYEALLSEAILTAPTFTLRGGTTEILRSVTARGLRS
jgi:Acyl-CoA dehydrogenase, middle domain/Acyl-CoA dehydrogenase, N-terminal domain